MSSDIVVKYKVLYTKDGKKKRKVFSDGFLVIRRLPVSTSCNHVVMLQSEEGDELWRTNDKNIDCYRSGEELQRGAYLLQIEEEVASSTVTASRIYGHDRNGTNQLMDIDEDKENIVEGDGVVLLRHSISSSSSSSRGTTKFRAPTAPSTHQKYPSKVARNALSDATNRAMTRTMNFVDDDFWNISNDKDSIFNDEIIDDEVRLFDSTSSSSSSSVSNTHAMEGPIDEHDAAFSSFSSSSGKRVLPSVELDPQLTSKMRPHQVEGAVFLLKRLTDPGPMDSPDGHRDRMHYTGAILADEVL